VTEIVLTVEEIQKGFLTKAQARDLLQKRLFDLTKRDNAMMGLQNLALTNVLNIFFGTRSDGARLKNVYPKHVDTLVDRANEMASLDVYGDKIVRGKPMSKILREAEEAKKRGAEDGAQQQVPAKRRNLYDDSRTGKACVFGDD
jgi:hypothetical protein